MKMVMLSQTSVLERVVLNYASLTENSNKFYIMEIYRSPAGFVLNTNYGRMGATGRISEKIYGSHGQARAELQKKQREKEGKGYRIVAVEDSPQRTSQPGEITSTRKRELDNISDKTLRLIGKLYSYATTFTERTVSTPLGSISDEQLQEGYRVLSRIEHAIRNNEPVSTYMSDEFYSIIPVIFGHKVNVSKMTLDTLEKIDRQRHLLDVMESIVEAQDSLQKSVEEKYKSLNVELKVLSKRTKEFKELQAWIKDTHSPLHNFGIDVQDIYSMEDEETTKRFNPYHVDTQILFHGSRNENILSILQNGLKIRPSNAVLTGNMFGNGIYLAKNGSKSAGYCWGFSRHNLRDSHYLLICEAATGKMKEYESSQSYLNSAPKGYHSVIGKKGPHLDHDEIIVYNENQCRIKYIVEFQKA